MSEPVTASSVSAEQESSNEAMFLRAVLKDVEVLICQVEELRSKVRGFVVAELRRVATESDEESDA